MRERIKEIREIYSYMDAHWEVGQREIDVILELIAEIERLEFELQCEKDAYGSDVIHILDVVEEGRMSKMAAHQRLNKVYRQRYSLLEKIKETTKELLNILPKIPIIAPVIDRLERLIAEDEEKKC